MEQLTIENKPELEPFLERKVNYLVALGPYIIIFIISFAIKTSLFKFIIFSVFYWVIAILFIKKLKPCNCSILITPQIIKSYKCLLFSGNKIAWEISIQDKTQIIIQKAIFGGRYPVKGIRFIIYDKGYKTNTLGAIIELDDKMANQIIEYANIHRLPIRVTSEY